jgi:hypothetical protein
MHRTPLHTRLWVMLAMMVLAALAVFASAASSTFSPSPMQATVYGANPFGLSQRDNNWEKDSDPNVRQLMVSTGAKWIRTSVSWAALASGGASDWLSKSTYFKTMTAQGLTIISTAVWG